MEPLNLTTGIELEFIIVYHEEAFASIAEEVTRPHDIPADIAIDYFLLQAGICTRIATDERDDRCERVPYSEWLIDSDILDCSPAEEAAVPKGWMQQHIELSSRVFSCSDDDWAAEVQGVVDVLAMMRSRFHCAILTNESTGLHVHMGHGPRTIPFPTAKRICQLFTAHESRLDQMHSAYRILAPGLEIPPFADALREDFWCAPASFFRGHYSPDGADYDPSAVRDENIFNWLSLIEDQTDYKALGSLNRVEFGGGWKCGHHAAVNFDNNYNNSYTEDATVKNTIEFRQHIGTIDARSITAWMTFLANMVNYCHTASDQDFILLLTKATDPTFTLSHLLTTSQCNTDLLRHFARDDEDLHCDINILNATVDERAEGYITEPMVAALVDHNDDEQSAGLQRSEIGRRCELKYTSGYYGLDPTAAAFPFDVADIRQLLDVAAVKAELECAGMFAPEDVTSVARADIFVLLAKMYSRLDNSLDPRHVIQREFKSWKVELLR